MGWLLANLLVLVAVDVGLVVDGKELVRIDGYQNGASQSLRGWEKKGGGGE